MPEKRTLERARTDAREGKAPTTQAGEFVREEMEHIREGKHGARSTKQAIAIGLSKARRAGVNLPPPPEGQVSEKTGARFSMDAQKDGLQQFVRGAISSSRIASDATPNHRGHSAPGRSAEAAGWSA